MVFPSADEWKKRLSERRMSDGEQIPESALLKLQGFIYLFLIFKKSFPPSIITSCMYCLYVIFMGFSRHSIDVMFPFFASVSCSLPEPQPDLIEELQYAELPQEAAQILLIQNKEEARRLLPPVVKPEKKPRWYKKRHHCLRPPPSNRMQWTAVHGWHRMH